ncbi:hypothetical protein ASPACDRAFT_1859079 [Aspergillus aculeatus ATCC 16872]|uniref:Uncharacterized protein n=1 Tax=Aspergillus aculeatus (strain ATCC 16872 / CBS 172.66 / WB 5094) TaxID=690307 RepID=A0A1L9WLH3_ASPA1|nr:uncharacterized protein ASPACDRAFT_1859079 [Aspergillus aculeatus ATCC 16872]OJJ97013.1 hypothetical protein ASPACDRAFT_1859079 [Aspergillus aculeatus ATCC 16872]
MLGQLNPLALPTPLNLETEVRAQLFSTFMNTFFASNSSLNVLSAKDDSWYFLMARFPCLAGESALLDRSIKALVCAFSGGKANDLPLMKYGGELYSDALRVMAWILRQPRSECKEAAAQMLLQHCLDLAERLHTCLPDGLSESRSSESRLSAPWDPSVLRPAPEPLPFPENDLAHPPLYEFANLATAKTVLLF